MAEHKELARCGWAAGDPLYVQYHDMEWGVPVHDDRKLFEFLVLEGAQAGLSWITILRRREEYRKAFADFDPVAVSKFDEDKIQSLLKESGIIRNELKIRAAVGNAAAFLKVQEEFGTFAAYCWRFVDGRPIKNNFKSLKEIPATTPEAEAFSKDLKKRGFKFIGPTIVYAFMQAIGMVNDHVVGCFRYKKLG